LFGVRVTCIRLPRLVTSGKNLSYLLTYLFTYNVRQNKSRLIAMSNELSFKMGRCDSVSEMLTVLGLPVFDALLCDRKHKPTHQLLL